MTSNCPTSVQLPVTPNYLTAPAPFRSKLEATQDSMATAGSLLTLMQQQSLQQQQLQQLQMASRSSAPAAAAAAAVTPEEQQQPA